MIARLEIEGHFFRYMKIQEPIQEIIVPIPRLPNHTVSELSSNEINSSKGFIELIFIDDGYSDIDGNRKYKLQGGLC